MKQLSKLRCLLLLCTIFFFLGCKKNNGGPLDDANPSVRALPSDVITDWYHLQLQIILQATPAYPNAATFRLFAFTGLGLYESLHAIIPSARSLHSVVYQMPQLPQTEPGKDYVWLEVANAELAASTRHYFPKLSTVAAASIDSLEAAYGNRLKANTSPEAFSRSQAFGQEIADSISSFSKTDKYALISAAYQPPVFPGAWVPAPPSYAAAATPYFGNVRPFLQGHITGVTPAPPYTYSTDSGSDFYKMVKDIYDVSFSRTADQTNIALFWNDVGAGRGYTPGGHAINILTELVEKEHLSLRTAVLCYVKAGMGMWDAAILCWRSKYNYNQLRPVTYIQSNIDSKWLPLIPTPAHPEFPAAHAFITTATMVSIASVIGDQHVVDDHTYDFLGYPHRMYASLNSVATECGMSRRYGGIHYQPSINTGAEAGKQIGLDVGNTPLGKAD